MPRFNPAVPTQLIPTPIGALIWLALARAMVPEEKPPTGPFVFGISRKDMGWV